VKVKGVYGELKIELESGVNYFDSGLLSRNINTKKIEISDISYFTIPIIINNAIFNSDKLIGTLTFKIPGINIEKKITILKKKIEFYNKYEYFNLDKNLLYYSESENLWKRVLKSNQIDSKNTYICPYYCWESNKIRYCYYSKRYYLSPTPENYFEIAYESHNFTSNKIIKVKGEEQRQRIMGLFNNNWVPLFDIYEKENDLFKLDDVRSLKKKYLISYLSNNYSYSAGEIITWGGYGSSVKEVYKTKNLKDPIDYNKIVEVLKKK
jgi:hypothetical protein